jgi:hypothetical protein
MPGVRGYYCFGSEVPWNKAARRNHPLQIVTLGLASEICFSPKLECYVEARLESGVIGKPSNVQLGGCDRTEVT